jgi:XTP/dITP diphosphohydrolase
MNDARVIVLASGNKKKLAEMQAILAPLGFTLRPQSDFGVPEAPEPHDTFLENALAKARNACVHTGLPAIADDSGLCVDALHGAPGVHSAYYAGAHKNDDDNNAKLIATLAGVQNRAAHYTALIVYLRRKDDPEPLVAHGQWRGEIVDTPQGAGGFGYDPYFYAPTHAMTAAQMPAAEKNAISHRAQALQKLFSALQTSA